MEPKDSGKPKTEVQGPHSDSVTKILTPEAREFLATLHRKFNPIRKDLLQRREARLKTLQSGELPDFLPETKKIRESDWVVAGAPADLRDRRVEITGPAEAKMMINALNSGAKVFMVDFEDSLSPTWKNVTDGQVYLSQAVRRELRFQSGDGKNYSLNPKIATLVVRPRGWHLSETHFLVDYQPISGSLFDFGLAFFHNAKEQLSRSTGPYFYLPKMESHLEARLWNEVFCFAQDYLKIPRGSIRATVLIETILAAFEMDEILWELREHAAGLNAGRWDYIFSYIKTFRNRKELILPDRSQITMNVPFMRAYSELLVKTCHKREAHAMGGMSAFIPNRKDAAVTEMALKKVREDKQRESRDGFDGTWVAHPDLVSIAMSEFDSVLGTQPHQKDKKRAEVQVSAKDLIEPKIAPTVSEAGIRTNINVALQYIDSWLKGVGAAAIHNLMEDAATAEISRAQLWQWLHQEVKLSNGTPFTKELYFKIREEELKGLGGASQGRLREAAQLLDRLVTEKEFETFLTLPAYPMLDQSSGANHGQRL